MGENSCFMLIFDIFNRENEHFLLSHFRQKIYSRVKEHRLGERCSFSLYFVEINHFVKRISCQQDVF